MDYTISFLDNKSYCPQCCGMLQCTERWANPWASTLQTGIAVTVALVLCDSFPACDREAVTTAVHFPVPSRLFGVLRCLGSGPSLVCPYPSMP
mmetsp:Transcript_29500/g.53023  ORF Transcript_29500/g.53023 Transcript_29500/m.53023 type:complete len:93 (+) Transcript_29500:297-575(+)